MNKNEYEIEKLKISSANTSRFFGLVKHIATLGTACFSVYIIMQGLTEIAGFKPDSLGALALVIEKLEVSRMLGYILAAGTGAGWFFERRGKQRAYKRLGEKRIALEKKDPYHPSSELDNDGQTPT